MADSSTHPVYRRIENSPSLRQNSLIFPSNSRFCRVGLLLEIMPGPRRLAIMANIGNPVTVSEMGDVEPAFDALKRGADEVVIDPLVSGSRVRINTLALDLRRPT